MLHLTMPPSAARGGAYTLWEPSESLDLALIDMNGSYVGAVANGSALYRDVPPGHYHIAPESFGRDRNVDLSPGQQLYVKIVSLDGWGMSVSGGKNCARVLRLANPAGDRASRNRSRPHRHLRSRGSAELLWNTPAEPLIYIYGAVQYVIAGMTASATIPLGVAIAIAGSIMLLIRPTSKKSPGKVASA